MVRAGGEVQSDAQGIVAVVAKQQCPQTVNVHELSAVELLHLSNELSGERIESQDRAAAKVADQQSVTEFAKGSRSQSKSPGSVEKETAFQTSDALALWVENTDPAETVTAYGIVFGGVLLCVGYVNVWSDGLHVEWSEIFGHLIVIESVVVKMDGMEGGVKDLDMTAAEVGGQDKFFAADFHDTRALVDRTIFCIRFLRIVHGGDRAKKVCAGLPAGDGAVFGNINEDRRVALNQEIRRADIEKDRGRGAGRRLAQCIGNQDAVCRDRH